MAEPPSRASWTDARAVLVLLAAGLLLGGGRIVLRPDLVADEEYIFGEHGNQLYRAERLAQGEWLYRDVADQYGPLPAYSYMLYTRWAGNTVAANLRWHLGGSLICLVLVYAVFRTGLEVGPALAGAVAALPLLLAPGGATVGNGALGNFLSFEHLALERCCFLGIMLLWRPPETRSAGQAASLGLLLGLWQTVKFGGVAFGGAALLIVDLLALWGLSRREWIAAARSWAWLLAAFAGVEGGLVLLACWLLPPDIAADTLWPAYVRQSYARLSSWPTLYGFPAFPAFQLLPMASAIVAAAALNRCLARRMRKSVEANPTERSDCRYFLGAVFYALAATAYLAHEVLFYQYAWVLIFPAVWAVVRVWPQLRRPAVVVVAAPYLMIVWTTFLERPPTDVVDYALPDGESLRMNSGAAGQIKQMAKIADEGRPDDFVVTLLRWGGGGFHHYYDPGYDLRNYMIDQGAERPYDEAELSAKLGRVKAFFVLKGATEDAERKIRSVFSRQLADRILDRFTLDAELSTPQMAVFLPHTEAVAGVDNLENPRPCAK